MRGYNFIHSLWCVCILIGITACQQGKTSSSNYQVNQGEIFHTLYNIKYDYPQSLENEILTELERFELSLNPFRDSTIITNINNNVSMQTDSLFTLVFNKAMEVSSLSDGKFDITASPLINAWGFGFKNMDSITPDVIDSLRTFVGYKKIRINDQGLIEKDDPRVQINTSALSKGFSCDLVAHLFDAYGIQNYMIEIGGEIVAKGKNDKNECWRIGIDKPIDDASGLQHELQTIIALCDKSLATSGNYRNFYVKGGKKYAHTIDPSTGYPAEQNILGATVIANDCMTADAWATAFMTMGTEKAIPLAQSIDGLSYYFIYTKPDSTLDVVYSPDFESFFAEKSADAN